MMEMQAVVSSNISQIGFDKTSGTIQVQFNNGGTYQTVATQEDFDTFLASKSKGKHFNNILKKAFIWSKITKQG